RRAGSGLQGPAPPPPVHPRAPHVEQPQVEAPPAPPPQPVATRRRGLHLHRPVVQHAADELADDGLVLHHQDPERRAGLHRGTRTSSTGPPGRCYRNGETPAGSVQPSRPFGRRTRTKSPERSSIRSFTPGCSSKATLLRGSGTSCTCRVWASTTPSRTASPL